MSAVAAASLLGLALLALALFDDDGSKSLFVVHAPTVPYGQVLGAQPQVGGAAPEYLLLQATPAAAAHQPGFYAPACALLAFAAAALAKRSAVAHPDREAGDEAAKVAVLFTSGRSAGKSRRAPAPVAGMFDFLAVGKAGAKHILLSDRTKANYLKGEIENGNMNFEAVAREYSTCPSAAKGGDLGTFGRGAMVKGFENYCFDPDTKVGELGIVGTQFGVHIVKLTKKP
jgi:peptidyl-prolyl cis-trans isomerase C